MADTDLVTVAEVEARLGDFADDADLALLISAASQAIEKRCQATFVQREFTEQQTGGPRARRGGYKRMHLKHAPIQSVTSIEDPSGETVPATDFVVDGDSGWLEHHSSWPLPVNGEGVPSYWEVIYLAGLFETTADVDANLKLAAITMIEEMRARPDGSVQSVKDGELSISYANVQRSSAGEFSPQVEALISTYIRVLV